MMRWIVAVLAVAACSKGPSEGQCKQLLDQLADLELKKAGPAATDDALQAERAKQKAALVEAKSSEFMSTCLDKTARDRVECALAATDLDGVAKCDDDK